mmetsp:Transcript_43829/g.103181  ORF Transcript_43829/g.103181 Transcript_43829/m.103181 type:complete len:295 (-) Transcript_43829:248-1132(-)
MRLASLLEIASLISSHCRSLSSSESFFDTMWRHSLLRPMNDVTRTSFFWRRSARLLHAMPTLTLPIGAVLGSTLPEGSFHLPSSFATAHSAFTSRRTRSTTNADEGWSTFFNAVFTACRTGSVSGQSSAGSISRRTVTRLVLLRARAAIHTFSLAMYGSRQDASIFTSLDSLPTASARFLPKMNRYTAMASRTLNASSSVFLCWNTTLSAFATDAAAHVGPLWPSRFAISSFRKIVSTALTPFGSSSENSCVFFTTYSTSSSSDFGGGVLLRAYSRYIHEQHMARNVDAIAAGP